MSPRVAVIPARGGSKRLPRKNILPVMGHPMLYYPVNAALASGCFNRVIVSTEDDEIRNAAIRAGAQVIDRPNHLAQDRSTVAQVCLDVLTQLSKEKTAPEWFCCIYPTAVFITPQDIIAAFETAQQCPDTDSVMGVSRFNLQPLQALEKDANGFLNPKWDEHKQQSQLHPDLVASNGTLYWIKTDTFRTCQSFYTAKLTGYEIPWIRAIDIDTQDDYETACRIAPLFLGDPTG